MSKKENAIDPNKTWVVNAVIHLYLAVTSSYFGTTSDLGKNRQNKIPPVFNFQYIVNVSSSRDI